MGGAALGTAARTATVMAPLSLPEAELDREQDPRGDRGTPSPRRLEAPPAHGVGGGLVEIRMACRFLDENLADLAIDQDVHPEEHGALDAEPARRGGIARVDLIPALRARVLGDGARRLLAVQRRRHGGAG
jgi:hypothetical protein